MIKKTRNVTSFIKREADVAGYMKEVGDSQVAGITRCDLFKMVLTSSVDGLIVIGRTSFIPNRVWMKIRAQKALPDLRGLRLGNSLNIARSM